MGFGPDDFDNTSGSHSIVRVVREGGDIAHTAIEASIRATTNKEHITRLLHRLDTIDSEKDALEARIAALEAATQVYKTTAEVSADRGKLINKWIPALVAGVLAVLAALTRYFGDS